MIRTEAFSEGGVHFIHSVGYTNRCVTPHSLEGGGWPFPSALGYQIDRPPRGVALPAGGKRLINFDRVNQIRGNRVEFHLAHAFRGWQVNAMEGKFGRAGPRATHL